MTAAAETEIGGHDVLRCADLLRDGHVRSAFAMADGFVRQRGLPLPQVLVDLLGAAQEEVGRRWHRGEWSVADEHAATAAAERVVTLLVAAADRQPAPGAGPHVLATCPGGEWHALPMRLVTEVLELRGATVTHLGASTPADDLASFLRRARPDVVALSCSTALSVPGALEAVQASHAVGVPVLAGGRALGRDGTRAAALGVDLWAPTAEAAADLLQEPLPTQLASPSGAAADAPSIARWRDLVVDRALERLPADDPLAGPGEGRRRRGRAHLLDLARAAEAAHLVGDPALVGELVAWVLPVLAREGISAAAVQRGVDALADAAFDVPPLRACLEAVPRIPGEAH